MSLEWFEVVNHNKEVTIKGEFFLYTVIDYLRTLLTGKLGNQFYLVTLTKIKDPQDLNLFLFKVINLVFQTSITP